MKILFPFAALLVVATSFKTDEISEALCRDNEEIVFSFSLARGAKIVSLCKDKHCDYLVYRFGTKGNIEFGTEYNIELEYPQKLDKTSWKKFELIGYKRFGGAANAGFIDYQLSFTNNNATYRIFESRGDMNDHCAIGIAVTVAGKETILKGNVKNKEGSLVRLDDDWDKIKNAAN